ncbi:MAG: hypothetical protein NC924_03160 [Candidatus Omnitrophica bacterium]|nr:hypothetical protein [Candidatus Omnitrophota bacterium]
MRRVIIASLIHALMCVAVPATSRATAVADAKATLSPQLALAGSFFHHLLSDNLRTSLLKKRYIERKLFDFNDWFSFWSNSGYSQEDISLFALIYLARYLRDDVGLSFASDFMTATAEVTRNFNNYLSKPFFQRYTSLVLHAARLDDTAGRDCILNGGFAHREDDAAFSKRLDEFLLRAVTTPAQRQAQQQRLVTQATAATQLMGGELDTSRYQLIDSLKSLTAGKFNKFSTSKIVLMPTTTCGAQCAHCSIVHSYPNKFHSKERTQFYRQALNFARVHNLHDVLIVGGDPLTFAFNDVMRILEMTPKDNVVTITTNGLFAKDPGATETILKQLWEIIEKREFTDFVLQVSFDSFHQEIMRTYSGELRENVPVANIANILQIAAIKFPQLNIALLSRLENFERGNFYALIKELDSRGINVPYQSPMIYAFLKLSGVNQHETIMLLSSQVDGIAIDKHDIFPFLYNNDFIFPLGWAQFLPVYQYAYSTHVDNTQDRWRLNYLTKPELIVDNNGFVYLSDAFYIHQFPAGNITRESFDEILYRHGHDPLADMAANRPSDLATVIAEVIPEIRQELDAAMYPHLKIISYLRSPALRLYLTQRLFQKILAESDNDFSYLPAAKMLKKRSLYALCTEYVKNAALENFLGSTGIIRGIHALIFPEHNPLLNSI